jgi:hypothetical protein
LEGGIHLLTSFLHQDYNITLIEPGGFTSFTDELRDKILDKHNLKKLHTTTVENFTTDIKFDFIFFINLLEHTDGTKQHTISCMNLLKDDYSLLFISTLIIPPSLNRIFTNGLFLFSQSSLLQNREEN